MTIKELSKYRNLKIEILQMEDRIIELEQTSINLSQITGMPFSSGNISNPTERVALKLAKLRSKLIKKMEKLVDKETKIDDYVNWFYDNGLQNYADYKFELIKEMN